MGAKAKKCEVCLARLDKKGAKNSNRLEEGSCPIAGRFSISYGKDKSLLFGVRQRKNCSKEII